MQSGIINSSIKLVTIRLACITCLASMGNFSASFPTPSRHTMMSGMCATMSLWLDVAPILSTSFVRSVSAPEERRCCVSFDSDGNGGRQLQPEFETAAEGRMNQNNLELASKWHKNFRFTFNQSFKLSLEHTAPMG